MKIMKIRQADGVVVSVPLGKGADGKTAYEYAQEGGYGGREDEFSALLANIIDQRKTTLKLHEDGQIYLFVNGKPVGNGVALPSGGVSGDIVGNVDSANNIVLMGSLADGTYTVKYEMEDGSMINIGTMVLDSNTYYSVTKNLTNCTVSNSATQVVAGGSYSATVTANSGYTLDSVSVTMGGSAVSVSGGVINIASVTGDIVITAVAEEIKANYTNLADPTSADWVVGKRFNSSGALVDVDSGVNGATTNYIGGDLVAGDIIRVKNMDLTTYRVAVYDSAKTFKITTPLNDSALESTVENVTVNTTEASFTVKAGSHLTSGGYIRFCGPLTRTSDDVIITKNEPIA